MDVKLNTKIFSNKSPLTHTLYKYKCKKIRLGFEERKWSKNILNFRFWGQCLISSFCSVFLWGHTKQISVLTSSSELRDHFWKCSRDQKLCRIVLALASCKGGKKYLLPLYYFSSTYVYNIHFGSERKIQPWFSLYRSQIF